MDVTLRSEGGRETHHVLPPSHQALVDHLGGIEAARVDVNALLDDRVGPRAEHLSDLVPARLDLRLPAGGWGRAHGVEMASRSKQITNVRSSSLAVSGVVVVCVPRMYPVYAVS